MLDSLSIAGVTLAALLQSCYTQQRPCVGLLFGQVTTAVSSQAQDTSDDVLVTHAACHIASTCTCVGTHAFYDNTGDISEEQLAVLLSSCSSSNDISDSSSNRQLLGWFSYRPNAPSIPSMQEAAVCKNLQGILDSSSSSNQQQQQQPLVFGLITSQLEHSGATMSLQHRFFAYHPDSTWRYSLEQYRPSSTFASFGGGTSGSTRTKAVHHPNLQPLELQVLNLGQPDMQRAATAAAAAGAATGSSAGGLTTGAAAAAAAVHGQGGGRQQLQLLTAVAAALEGSGTANAGMHKQLVAAAQQVHAPGGQLSIIEGLYSSLLKDLESAAATVGKQIDQLVALQEQNQRLRGQLLAGQAGAVDAAVVAHAHDLL